MISAPILLSSILIVLLCVVVAHHAVVTAERRGDRAGYARALQERRDQGDVAPPNP